MCFPIDRDTFLKIRKDRNSVIITDPDNSIYLEKFIWRYWMTDLGEVFAVLGEKVIKFGDYEIDYDISGSEWKLDLINIERPKEAIKNHLHRGGYVAEITGNTPISNGNYRISCPRIGKSYDIYLFIENSNYMPDSVYIWWPEKSKILTSLPLIIEMKSFYRAALWKKF